jgi:hypothetical protein
MSFKKLCRTTQYEKSIAKQKRRKTLILIAATLSKSMRVGWPLKHFAMRGKDNAQ